MTSPTNQTNPFTDLFSGSHVINTRDKVEFIVDAFKNAATPAMRAQTLKEYTAFRIGLDLQRSDLAEQFTAATALIDADNLRPALKQLLDDSKVEPATFPQKYEAIRRPLLQGEGIIREGVKTASALLSTYSILADAEKKVIWDGIPLILDTPQVVLEMQQSRQTHLSTLVHLGQDIDNMKNAEREFAAAQSWNTVKFITKRPVKALKPATFGQHS